MRAVRGYLGNHSDGRVGNKVSVWVSSVDHGSSTVIYLILRMLIISLLRDFLVKAIRHYIKIHYKKSQNVISYVKLDHTYIIIVFDQLW